MPSAPPCASSSKRARCIRRSSSWHLATALGEFAAGAALATSEDVGPMSDDLAALVREVMCEHHQMLRMIELPALGNA